MADNSSKRKVNSSLDMLRKQVNDLYTTTYFTRDTSEEIKTQVSDRLDDAIRKADASAEMYLFSNAKMVLDFAKNNRADVELPNVNIVNEMVDMITASRAYEANATAIQSAKSMANAAINISN